MAKLVTSWGAQGAAQRALPVTVEAEPVHHATCAEGQRVARLVDDANEGIGAWDPRQSVFGAMAAVHKVGKVPLRAGRCQGDGEAGTATQKPPAGRSRMVLQTRATPDPAGRDGSHWAVWVLQTLCLGLCK